MATTIEPIPDEDSIRGVVQPSGYHLLVRIPRLEAQMKNCANLYMPEDTRRLEEAASLTGQVVAVGPEAYGDKAKFPSGPWCRAGDFVMFRAYSGTRFSVRDTEYRLINDDTVQGVIRDDPTEIKRAY